MQKIQGLFRVCVRDVCLCFLKSMIVCLIPILIEHITLAYLETQGSRFK